MARKLETEKVSSGTNEKAKADKSTGDALPKEIKQSKKAVSKSVKKKAKTKPAAKKSRTASTPPKHGRRYLRARQIIERDKMYSLKEAVALVKKTTATKFDSTVELHIRLAASKKGKKEGSAPTGRGLVKLPEGSPKEKRIVVADEALIAEIAKGRLDFDILLSTPETMPKLARVAKVLGPKGMMPSPKAGTVTSDPEKTKKELAGGTTEYRADSHGIIHLAIAKVSWDSEKIERNISAVLDVLPKNQIASITLSSTMGPGVKIAYDK